MLIVDDSRSFRLAARELLECRGYAVVAEVGSAAEAVDAVEREPPDALLLDLHLPDLHGSVLAALLHARYPALAILLVSAQEHEDIGALIKCTGARGFVSKCDLGKVDLTSYLRA